MEKPSTFHLYHHFLTHFYFSVQDLFLLISLFKTNLKQGGRWKGGMREKFEMRLREKVTPTRLTPAQLNPRSREKELPCLVAVKYFHSTFHLYHQILIHFIFRLKIYFFDFTFFKTNLKQGGRWKGGMKKRFEIEIRD